METAVEVTAQRSSTQMSWATVAGKTPPPCNEAAESTTAQKVVVAPPPQPDHKDTPPRPVQEAKKASGGGATRPQLFVGNIPDSVEESELKEFFERYGTVLKVRIRLGKKGRSNFGFVEFDDPALMQSVIDNKRVMFRDGVYLNVEETSSVRSDRGGGAATAAGLHKEAEPHAAMAAAAKGGEETSKKDSSALVTAPESWSVVGSRKSRRAVKPTQQRTGGDAPQHPRKGSRPKREDKGGGAQVLGSSDETSATTGVESAKPEAQKEVALAAATEKKAATSPSWAKVARTSLPSGGDATTSSPQRSGGHTGARPAAEGGRKGEAQQTRGSRYAQQHQLFVGNIPHNVDEAELKEFFEKYGTVLRVIIKICAPKNNFGFVTFKDAETVQNILGSRPVRFRGDWRLNVEEMKNNAGSSSAPHKYAKIASPGPEVEARKEMEATSDRLKSDNLMEPQAADVTLTWGE